MELKSALNTNRNVIITGADINVTSPGNYKHNGATIDHNYVNALSKFLFAAKGDLIVGTGGNNVQRLGVGTNGQLLAADSSDVTGVRWVDPPAAGSAQGYVLPTNLVGTSNLAFGLNLPSTGHVVMHAVFNVSGPSNGVKLRVTRSSTNVIYVGSITGEAALGLYTKLDISSDPTLFTESGVMLQGQLGFINVTFSITPLSAGQNVQFLVSSFTGIESFSLNRGTGYMAVLV